MVSGSDRFKIVTHPFLPGICRSCGVPYGRRTLVDTGLDADFCNRQHVEGDIDINTAGAVYFCESCIINMAELVDCIAPVRGLALQQELAQVLDESATLKQKILGLEGIVNGYRTLRIDSSPAFSQSLPNVPALLGTEEFPTGHIDYTGESATNGSGVPEERESVLPDGNTAVDKPFSEPGSPEYTSWVSGSRSRTPEWSRII